jgi:flavin-dependent dehydrogenase
VKETYDAIVVGARCAGSPTAMLLARWGYRVLVVDRATFPSDTVSTHIIHPPGVAALERWGLLERLEATGCPAAGKYSYDFGPFTIAGSPQPTNGVSVAYGPRRTVLDNLLVDAASEEGAEVREAFTVDELLFDDGRVIGLTGRSHGKRVTDRARVVIGADGRHSLVAKAVRPHQYNEKPQLEVMYYTYWSGLPTDSFEAVIRPGCGWGVIPTHDDLTMVVTGWPYAEFEAIRRDIEGRYLKAFELAPAFAERVRAAKREARFVGTAITSFFRKPFGPGWALVGDAGYNKDPVTAWGISDAFRDAELCASALDEWFSGSRPFEDAMGDYHRIRDEHSFPMFELTCGFATLEPPPPEMQQLLAAVQRDQEEMDAFVSVMAGTLPVTEFFAPANVDRIVTAAAHRPVPRILGPSPFTEREGEAAAAL